MRTASTIVLLLTLAACESPGNGEARILARDWLRAEIRPNPAPLYCYGTLGRPDCHEAPIPQEQNRLKGYYGPPPLAVPPATILVVTETGLLDPTVARPPSVEPMIAIPAAPTPLKPRYQR